MDLSLDFSLAEGYKSRSQIARIVTEAWVKKHLICPICQLGELGSYPNNHQSVDFICAHCKEKYQLKSSSRRWGRTLTGAAYHVLETAIKTDQQPNFILLNYDSLSQQVRRILFLERRLITLDVIEQRSPLGLSAERAGWIGYKLLLFRILDYAQTLL